MEDGLGIAVDEGAPPETVRVRVGEAARPGIGTVVAGACFVASLELGPAAGATARELVTGVVAARGSPALDVLRVDGPAALRIGVAASLRGVVGFGSKSGFGLGGGLGAAFDAIVGFEAGFGGGGFPIVGLTALADTKLSSSEASAASPAFIDGDIGGFTIKVVEGDMNKEKDAVP